MAVRIPAPQVLVVCILAAAVTPALLGGLASATPERAPVEQTPPRSDGGERANAGAASGKTPSPPANGTAAPPSPAKPAAPPGVANATGGDGEGEGEGDDSGPGSLLGGIPTWFASITTALSNPLKAFQGIARKVMHMLIDRPVPTRNGDPAWIGRPDGAIMGAVYDLAWTKTVPVGILVSALYAGFATGMRGLVPPSVVPNRQAAAAVWKALGTVVHVLLGWSIMVGWAVLVHAIATLLAPSGATVLPGGQSLIEQVISGGAGGYILWVSSGVLAVLVMIVWVLSWLGALLAPPAYPLLVAANPPDVPVLRKFRMLPETGILFTLVAMPVPTAFVLGLGYPTINALRTATTGPIASIGGIALASLLTLGMWFLALIAPLVMLWKSGGMRPVEMFAAGALGAATAMSVHDRAGKLSDALPSPGGMSPTGTAASAGAGTGGGGTTIDPLEGSPFQHSSDGGVGGALGGGQGTAGGAGVAPAPSTSTSSTGSATAGSAGSGSIGEASRTVSSIDEIPEGQQYEIGIEMSDGKWQPVENNTYPREFLSGDDDAFSRIEDAVDADTVYVRGVQDAETYDIRTGLDDH